MMNERKRLKALKCTECGRKIHVILSAEDDNNMRSELSVICEECSKNKDYGEYSVVLLPLEKVAPETLKTLSSEIDNQINRLLEEHPALDCIKTTIEVRPYTEFEKSIINTHLCGRESCPKYKLAGVGPGNYVECEHYSSGNCSDPFSWKFYETDHPEFNQVRRVFNTTIILCGELSK